MKHLLILFGVSCIIFSCQKKEGVEPYIEERLQYEDVPEHYIDEDRSYYKDLGRTHWPNNCMGCHLAPGYKNPPNDTLPKDTLPIEPQDSLPPPP